MSPTIIRELSIHAAIEEQVLYPAMRKALPDGETLVQEAIDEHQQVKETLAAIERADTPTERDPLLTRLIGNVRHHVEEEETELFPKLRASITVSELRDLGGKLASAKKLAPTHPHPKAPEHASGQPRRRCRRRRDGQGAGRAEAKLTGWPAADPRSVSSGRSPTSGGRR